MNCCPCWISSERKTGGFIDGGRSYARCGGSGVLVRIYVDQTDKELEEDWKNGTNKYGRIKGDVGIRLEDPL